MAKRIKAYFIAGPVGDYLEDFSISSIKVLKRVKIIINEKGFQSLISFLQKKNILRKDVIQYEAYDDPSKFEFMDRYLDEIVESNNDFAVLSDSGLPCFCDPGHTIVDYIYKKYSDKVEVITLGSSSALDSAIVHSGMDFHKFIFSGIYPENYNLDFLLFEKIPVEKIPVIFYVKKDFLFELIGRVKKYYSGVDCSIIIVSCIRKRSKSYASGAFRLKTSVDDDISRFHDYINDIKEHFSDEQIEHVVILRLN